MGRLVATHADVAFVDTDALVEERAGRSIAAIFTTDGEDAFRRAEVQAVRDAAATEGPAVIATGGGAVLDVENVHVMRQTGVVVWLDAPAEVLAARVGADVSRPLASDPGAFQRLASERRRAYELAAHHRLEIAEQDVDETARRLTELWESGPWS